MALDTDYTLKGTIVYADDGEAADGVTVTGVDFDISQGDDVVGTTQTDSSGRFDISFDGSDAGGRNEGTPEPYLIVASEEGRHLGQTSHRGGDEGPEYDFGRIEVPRASEDVPEKTEGRRPSEPKAPHGSKSRREPPPRSPFFHGKFGRLFRKLPAWAPPGNTDEEKLGRIGRLARQMQEPAGTGWDAPDLDNEAIPAAYTYLGQFVDHDITFDPASSLQRKNDPEELHNFRTPRFDLDNLYGGGPEADPFLYDRRPSRDGKFLIGKARRVAPGISDTDILLSELKPSREDDLPRNEQGTALIGDPRNDENLIVAQVQLAMLKFHNKMVDWVGESEGLEGGEAFERARDLVRWHYQWVVLRDFLPRIADPGVVNDVLFGGNAPPRGEHGGDRASPYALDLKHFTWKNAPYMPVEFSVAAYRIGHSMIRPAYVLNDKTSAISIFEPPSTDPGQLEDLRGGRPLPPSWTLDWSRFLDLGAGDFQSTRLIDTKLNRKLAKIPAGPGKENPLALLNLWRGWRMGLPSGQSVARVMGEEVRSNETLGLGEDVAGREAPLWYYVLREAELEADGEHLGPVGSRIVAEVFAGLAAADPHSFLNQNPSWTPASVSIIEPRGDTFELRDIMRFAEVA